MADDCSPARYHVIATVAEGPSHASYKVIDAPTGRLLLVRRYSGDLLRDPNDRASPVAAVPLLVVRGDASSAFAPVDDTPLAAGDEILLAGVPAARRALDAVCHSDPTRDYVLLGRDAPSGSIWRWIERAPG